ncbi:hypothetical protein SPBR_08230 [Sporothrix brasiliensis 5110]|uniref:ferric-chelate reductase (NADPH) n=1 Tax=Sporothrix brasiliensis 5110 TaxID=1398154 RepID=A0A0C2IC27_9PEZI|nr:uncharacterized protein SPBR_08230 [Sporothrix brasiliensis 5110]KIH86851.1 hypothetical protein SPBR_08230 [Sporothrix brasiliensis 5110]
MDGNGTSGGGTSGLLPSNETAQNSSHPMGDHGGHGGHGGGGGSPFSPAQAAMFAARQAYNERTATYYAAAICGLIAVFTFLHWSRKLASRSPFIPAPLARPFVVISRRLRNLLVRPAPGLNSSGHGLLVAVYVAINLTLMLTNVDNSSLSPEASRFGWLLVTNLCFVVFLALKNTPLAYLTSYSYERLNCLHQIAGCTTFLLMVIHASSYTAFFFHLGKLEVLREHAQIAGMIAGFMFLIMVTAALLLRRYAYEAFYVMHLTAFCVAIVCIGFHRPDIHTRIPVVLSLTAALFATDRLIRVSRLLLNSTSNEATIYPLPNGGTRILLAKKPPRAVPGKHVLMWIPAVRTFEMHPFTIIDTEAANGSTEFVVKSYNGFTRKLHAQATANPGQKLWAAAEGPYGTFPDPMEYDKIILIAGGSGASYTFGLVGNMLERMDAQSAKNIVFIWTAKTQETLSWFSGHLDTLRSHPNAPKVHVSLYVTRVPGSSSSDEDIRHTTGHRVGRTTTRFIAGGATASTAGRAGPTTLASETTTSDLHHDSDKEMAEEKEKVHVVQKEHATSRNSDDIGSPSAGANVAADLEKATAAADAAAAAANSEANGTESQPLRHSFSPGRPDAETVIRTAVSSTARIQRVLVAACGPPTLMKTVRSATAKCITSDGPSVELHCEQFSW